MTSNILTILDIVCSNHLKIFNRNNLVIFTMSSIVISNIYNSSKFVIILLSNFIHFIKYLLLSLSSIFFSSNTFIYQSITYFIRFHKLTKITSVTMMSCIQSQISNKFILCSRLSNLLSSSITFNISFLIKTSKRINTFFNLSSSIKECIKSVQPRLHIISTSFNFSSFTKTKRTRSTFTSFIIFFSLILFIYSSLNFTKSRT